MIDQATKELAVSLLDVGQPAVRLPGPFTLELTFNEAGAFGFPAPSWVFLVVTVLVTGIVIRNLPHATSNVQAMGYGLLLAGALGNGMDRVFRPGGEDDARYLFGHVVDFIASDVWPTFNVADMAITFGLVALIVTLWLEGRADSAPS